jgi:molybdopterin converting factor small subunit
MAVETFSVTLELHGFLADRLAALGRLNAVLNHGDVLTFIPAHAGG